MSPDKSTINRFVQKIVQLVHPMQIILFGSAVRGEWQENSDLDFLIVMPNGTHRRQTAQQLYQQMTGMKIPFDVVVATPNDLEQYKQNVGYIYHTILNEGIEIYAQPA